MVFDLRGDVPKTVCPEGETAQASNIILKIQKKNLLVILFDFVLVPSTLFLEMQSPPHVIHFDIILNILPLFSTFSTLFSKRKKNTSVKHS